MSKAFKIGDGALYKGEYWRIVIGYKAIPINLDECQGDDAADLIIKSMLLEKYQKAKAEAGLADTTLAPAELLKCSAFEVDYLQLKGSPSTIALKDQCEAIEFEPYHPDILNEMENAAARREQSAQIVWVNQE